MNSGLDLKRSTTMGEYADMAKDDLKDDEYRYRETGDWPECEAGPTTWWERLRAWVHHLVWHEENAFGQRYLRLWVAWVIALGIVVGIAVAIAIPADMGKTRCERARRDAAVWTKAVARCQQACDQIGANQAITKGSAKCTDFDVVQTHGLECWCEGGGRYQDVTDFVW